MKAYVQLTIRAEVNTSDWLVGENLIGSLESSGGGLCPEQVSHNADKFTDIYVNKSACRDVWASTMTIGYGGAKTQGCQDFAWKRKQPIKSSGRVAHTTRNVSGQIVPGDISFKAEWVATFDWYSLFLDGVNSCLLS